MHEKSSPSTPRTTNAAETQHFFKVEYYLKLIHPERPHVGGEKPRGYARDGSRTHPMVNTGNHTRAVRLPPVGVNLQQ